MNKFGFASTALLALSLAVTPGAWTANYPTKPVRLVVPYPAGGGTDFMARAVAQRLGDSLGQVVIIDNCPAVDGVIGTHTVATSRADGYTQLLVSSSHAINASLGRKLPYDTLKDFARSYKRRISSSCLWCIRRCRLRP